jgi:hypothetical protein
MELRFTPETAVRIGTALLTGVDITSLVYRSHESDRTVFVYGQGIWTYDFNRNNHGESVNNKYSFNVHQFQNIANFNSVAYETVVNATHDYMSDVWESIVADILPIHVTHMNGEATGALFINVSSVHGLLASYRTKHKINDDATECHYSPSARNTLLERVNEYGVIILNDNDAMESERLRIEYEIRSGQKVSID